MYEPVCLAHSDNAMKALVLRALAQSPGGMQFHKLHEAVSAHVPASAPPQWMEGFKRVLDAMSDSDQTVVQVWAPYCGTWVCLPEEEDDPFLSLTLIGTAEPT